MLVRIGHQVLSPSSQAGSYLSMVLANCLVEVKRNFDKNIVSINYEVMEIWKFEGGSCLTFYTSCMKMS